jgi:hypothetical protein
MGLAVALASGPAAAELTVRPNELAPAGLDVLVGKQALAERMRLEIKPRGADLPATGSDKATATLSSAARAASRKAGFFFLSPCQALLQSLGPPRRPTYPKRSTAF